MDIKLNNSIQWEEILITKYVKNVFETVFSVHYSD